MEVKKMKRTFLKVLPFAAALLLATSCSKDENNSSDEIVNNNEQTEIVTKTFKTLTVKGKVNKSISKVTVGDGYALAFEGTEKFTFGSSSEDVYGTIDFSGTEGDYTATINYTDEEALNGSFIATLGSNSATSSAYDNLATAVQNSYYTIIFTISQEGEVYKLKSGETDLVVNLQSAFIQALCAKTTQLGGTDFTVEKGKYYVVPVGQTMDETEKTTVAGQIYTIATKLTLDWGTAKELVWGNNTKTVTATVDPAQNITWSYSGGNANNVYTENDNTFSVFLKGTGNFTITATAEDGTTATCNITVPTDYVDLGTGVYWKTSDEGPYIFKNLPSGTPTKEQFSKLWDGTVTVSGKTFTNKNGSGASITLTQSVYWSKTQYNRANGWYVLVLSGKGSWHYDGKSNDRHVRLVRAAQ
jgi:hypothetical protein